MSGLKRLKTILGKYAPLYLLISVAILLFINVCGFLESSLRGICVRLMCLILCLFTIAVEKRGLLQHQALQYQNVHSMWAWGYVSTPYTKTISFEIVPKGVGTAFSRRKSRQRGSLWSHYYSGTHKKSPGYGPGADSASRETGAESSVRKMSPWDAVLDE